MPPVRNAEPPFDDAKADIILRASDNVDFRVFKTILSLASPLFKDMFSLPQPSTDEVPQSPGDEYRDGLLVIPFTEDALTLDFILRSCYPVRSPKINGINDLPKILIAARKYQIEVFEGVAESALEAAISDDPVGVYAIALRFGLHDVADKAARRTVHYPVLTYSEPLMNVSIPQYFRLLKYRDDCAIAATAVAESRAWFEPCPNSLWQNASSSCDCYMRDKAIVNGGRVWSAPDFLWDFLARAGIGLRDRSFGAWLVEDLDWDSAVTQWKSRKCAHPYGGGKQLSDGMDKFRRIFAQAVERAVDAVRVFAIAQRNEQMLMLGHAVFVGSPAPTLNKCSVTKPTPFSKIFVSFFVIFKVTACRTSRIGMKFPMFPSHALVIYFRVLTLCYPDSPVI